jgi:hypothetical protein
MFHKQQNYLTNLHNIHNKDKMNVVNELEGIRKEAVPSYSLWLYASLSVKLEEKSQPYGPSLLLWFDFELERIQQSLIGGFR